MPRFLCLPPEGEAPVSDLLADENSMVGRGRCKYPPLFCLQKTWVWVSSLLLIGKSQNFFLPPSAHLADGKDNLCPIYLPYLSRWGSDEILSVWSCQTKEQSLEEQFSNLSVPLKHPEGLLQHNLLGPTAQNFGSVSLVWGRRKLHFLQVSVVAGTGTMLWEPLSWISKRFSTTSSH